MFNQAPHHIGACGSGDSAPRILIFGIISRALVNLPLNRFTPLVSIITGYESDPEPVFVRAPAENRTPNPRFRLNFIFENPSKSVDEVSILIKI